VTIELARARGPETDARKYVSIHVRIVLNGTSRLAAVNKVKGSIVIDNKGNDFFKELNLG
jgi:hypothetical protein